MMNITRRSPRCATRRILLTVTLPLTMAATATAILPGSGHAQSPPPGPASPRSFWSHIPIGVSGQASTTGELYRHGGSTEARRPGTAWRVSMSPQATLFHELGVSADLLLSSEG